jgi:hypothetical protein
VEVLAWVMPDLDLLDWDMPINVLLLKALKDAVLVSLKAVTVNAAATKILDTLLRISLHLFENIMKVHLYFLEHPWFVTNVDGLN